MNNMDDDFDYRDGKEYDPEFCDGVTLFNHINNELQYGRVMEEISKLSQFDRMLYQEQDFFYAGTKVFKKIDPCDQALDGDAGHDIVDANDEERKEWEQKLAMLVDPNYDDAMNYIIDEPLEDVIIHPTCVDDEREFHRVISIDFASLTGPFCALGYTPPRDKYKFIGNFAPNINQMKARDREDNCRFLVGDCKRAESIKELNRIVVDIRKDYQHDKEIRTKWGEVSRKQERTKVELDMRAKGSDEETIRQRIWKDFDRMPGKFVSKGKYIKSNGSKWHRERGRAYQEVIMTYNQWQSIYKAIDERKAYLLVGFSDRVYRDLEKQINTCADAIALQRVHEIVSDKVDDLNKIHRQQIWKIWGTKAKQKGLRGERY